MKLLIVVSKLLTGFGTRRVLHVIYSQRTAKTTTFSRPSGTPA